MVGHLLTVKSTLWRKHHNNSEFFFVFLVWPMEFKYEESSSYKYCVRSVLGNCTWTTMNTCWKWDRIVFGENGKAPCSWKTIVTISLPIWRFRKSWNPSDNKANIRRWISDTTKRQNVRKWKKFYVTCCLLLGVKGNIVETWNMIS